MSLDDRVVLVRPDERAAGPVTAGIDRRQAFAIEGAWAGYVTTEAGMASAWHHHGEYETVIYVVAGVLRMEFGSGGARSIDAGPGDFVLVRKGVVHRESTPGEAVEAVVVRAGTGESTFNFEGPEP